MAHGDVATLREGIGGATTSGATEDRRTVRPVTDRWVRHGLRVALIRRPEVKMEPHSLCLDGRRVHFAVSDNHDAHGPDGPGSPPIWAVNIHGFFAGGWMYARESARIAERLGWRVVNPSLPGFGGSDPLDVPRVTLPMVTEQMHQVLRHLGAGPAVLLGHSMGGAVAVQQAASHPEATLGIVYRAGVATPAWRRRKGLVRRLTALVLPDLADAADMFGAIVADAPDLLAGRLYSTVRTLWPDVRRNLSHVGQTYPLGSMLMSIDLRAEVRRLAEAQMPVLAEWGCFDRVVPPDTAEEFTRCAKTPVQWVPGGHSWMLARPQGQVDVLTYIASGQRFCREVETRWRALWRSTAALGSTA